MKRKLSFLTALVLLLTMIPSASAATENASGGNRMMLFALIALVLVTILAFAVSIVLTVSLIKAGKRSSHGRMKSSFKVLISCAYIVAVLALVFTVFCGVRYNEINASLQNPPVGSSDNDSTTGSTGGTVNTNPSETTQPPETTVPPTTVPPEPVYTLGTVQKTENSDPASWIKKWDIIVDDEIVDSFTREEAISFGDPNKESYFPFPGIATFRGDNYRTGSSYGTANIVNNAMDTVWTKKISSLSKGSSSGAWTGAGWTGQPLMVEWDEETKQIMNLYPEKKAKEGLVEVIYATLDGHIYFYDLDDGSYTRDPMNVGMAFKGSGSLDPRGYPIMYVGSGDLTASGKKPRMYIINLIDCSIMYEHGHKESYSLRNWIAFDSAPLVDAETDTLIWPGETGVLYTIKLNTKYDKAAGTLSITPDAPVKNRYKTNTGYTLGFEASSIIVENYAYIADNGGMFFCVDLNTMELVWAQNTKDDVNATPVFEWGDDGVGYIYTSTSMENCNGKVYIYKLNASTGEIVWELEFDDVYFDKSVSGGILSSPLLGKKGTALEGMIYYAIAKTPGAYSGILLAIDTETGKVAWEKSQNLYCWSSPAAVYDDNGNAKIIICDAGGYIYMLDPATGETVSRINVGANVEATPAIFNDMLVVGTRGQEVYGIRLN